MTSTTYRAVKRGCGITAVAATTCYTLASSMALSDGHDVGIEVPQPVNALSIMLIVCTTLVASGAWLLERSHQIAAERQIRPVVRDEIEKAIADTMPLFVASVAESLDRRLVPQMREVAVTAGKQTAVRLHEMVTQDIRDICNDAHRRALVTGQAMQAAATGETIGRAALRSIPRTFVSTSRED